MIEVMAGASTLPTLVANTYRNELLDKHLRAQEFEFLCELISKVTIKKLHLTDEIKSIKATCNLLLKDFRLDIEG